MTCLCIPGFKCDECKKIEARIADHKENGIVVADVLREWVRECWKLAQIRAEYGGYIHKEDVIDGMVTILNREAHRRPR